MALQLPTASAAAAAPTNGRIGLGQLVAIATGENQARQDEWERTRHLHKDGNNSEDDQPPGGVRSIVTNSSTLCRIFEAPYVDAPLTVIAQRVGSVLVLDVDSGDAIRKAIEAPSSAAERQQQQQKQHPEQDPAAEVVVTADENSEEGGGSSGVSSRQQSQQQFAVERCASSDCAVLLPHRQSSELTGGMGERAGSDGSMSGGTTTMTVDVSRLLRSHSGSPSHFAGDSGGNGGGAGGGGDRNGNGRTGHQQHAARVALDDLLMHCAAATAPAASPHHHHHHHQQQQQQQQKQQPQRHKTSPVAKREQPTRGHSNSGGVPDFVLNSGKQKSSGGGALDAGHAAAAADIVKRSPTMLPRSGSSLDDTNNNLITPVTGSPPSASVAGDTAAGCFPAAAAVAEKASGNGGGDSDSSSPSSPTATTNVVRWRFGSLDVLLSVDHGLMRSMESYLMVSGNNGNNGAAAAADAEGAEEESGMLPRSADVSSGAAPTSSAPKTTAGGQVAENTTPTSGSVQQQQDVLEVSPHHQHSRRSSSSSSSSNHHHHHHHHHNHHHHHHHHGPRPRVAPSTSLLSSATSSAVFDSSDNISSSSPAAGGSPTAAAAAAAAAPSLTLSRREAMDAWFDSMINTSNAVAVCVHQRGGGRQEYHVMPATSSQMPLLMTPLNELTRSSKFPAVNALQTAGNVFNWLLMNCTTEGGSYVVTRKPDCTELMLFEIGGGDQQQQQQEKNLSETRTGEAGAHSSSSSSKNEEGNEAIPSPGTSPTCAVPSGSSYPKANGARKSTEPIVEEVPDSDEDDNAAAAAVAAADAKSKQVTTSTALSRAIVASSSFPSSAAASSSSSSLEAVQSAVAVLCMRMAQNILSSESAGQEDQVLSLLMRCAELDGRQSSEQGQAQKTPPSNTNSSSNSVTEQWSLRAHAIALIPQIVRRRCLQQLVPVPTSTGTSSAIEQQRKSFLESSLGAVTVMRGWVHRLTFDLGAQLQSLAEISTIAMGISIKVLSDVCCLFLSIVGEAIERQHHDLKPASSPCDCPLLGPVSKAAVECLVDSARTLEMQVSELMKRKQQQQQEQPTNSKCEADSVGTLAEGWLSCLRELTADCCVMSIQFPFLFASMQEVVNSRKQLDEKKREEQQQQQQPQSMLFHPFTLTFSHSKFDLARLCYVALQSYKHCTIGRERGTLARKTAQVSYVMGVQHLRSGRFTKATEHLRAALSECRSSGNTNPTSYQEDEAESEVVVSTTTAAAAAAAAAEATSNERTEQNNDSDGDTSFAGAAAAAASDSKNTRERKWWWDFRGAVLRCDEAHMQVALGDAARKRAEFEQAARPQLVTDREMDAWRDAVNRYQIAIEICFDKAGVSPQQHQQQNSTSGSGSGNGGSNFIFDNINSSNSNNEYFLFHQSIDALPSAARSLVHETRLLLLQTSLVYSNRVASSLAFRRQSPGAAGEQQAAQAWCQDVRDVTRHVEDIVASALRRISASSASKHARSNAERLRLLSHALRCQYVPPAFIQAVAATSASGAPPCPCSEMAKMLENAPSSAVCAMRVAALCYVVRGWKCLSLTWDADDVELDAIRCDGPTAAAALAPSSALTSCCTGAAAAVSALGPSAAAAPLLCCPVRGNDRERELLRLLRVPSEEETATRMLFLMCVMELDLSYQACNGCSLTHAWMSMHVSPICEQLLGECAPPIAASCSDVKMIVNGILKQLPSACDVAAAAADILQRLATPPRAADLTALVQQGKTAASWKPSGGRSAAENALIGRRKLITAFCRTILNYTSLVAAREAANGFCTVGNDKLRALATFVLKAATGDSSSCAVTQEKISEFKSWMLKRSCVELQEKQQQH